MIFHPLTSDIEKPELFNNLFYYEPHPLSILAAEKLQQYLSLRNDWKEEIDKGKMFGVLVVEDKNKQTGCLWAYSGQIGGREDWDDFVPAVFDYLTPDGYFKTNEAEISAMNREISDLENDEQLLSDKAELARLECESDRAIAEYKEKMRIAKAERDKVRNEDVLQDEEKRTELIRESQFMKAELRRMKKRFAESITGKEKVVNAANSRIDAMKKERKRRSDELQHWLFGNFNILNAEGESRNLTEIFAETVQKIPPSGAGECCEPKLLQYAYKHLMRPVCMAMFWWGKSPKAEIRHHLSYYPACKGKCKPILEHALKGLKTELPDIEKREFKTSLETVYEDEHIVVILKPAGMLSVPGRNMHASVYSLMRQRYPDADSPLIVHRLDMDTSGLMVIAKTKQAHKNIQAQFNNHTVRKKYTALIERTDNDEKLPKRGMINLPLRPDNMHRPCQMVDFERGKAAVTQYEITEITPRYIRISLFPNTGRTHQLRVHCAHPLSLNAPIIGDTLYGTKAERLFLHAEEITFLHPVTNIAMRFSRQADF